MQRKLDWLSPISDTPDKYGNVYVNMKFDDGTLAYKAAQPEAMAQHYADLLGIQLAGDLVEIELEDAGLKTQKGVTKYKLVGYPGWSAPVGQGGKAQANAHNNGDREDAITRAVALKAAVRYSVAQELNTEGVLKRADIFYEWLVRGEGQTDATGTERPTDPIPAQRAEGTNDGGRLQPVKAADASPVPSAPSASNVPSVGVTGKDPAEGTTSEGGAASPGGEGTASPEDNPWAGMDVK